MVEIYSPALPGTEGVWTHHGKYRWEGYYTPYGLTEKMGASLTPMTYDISPYVNEEATRSDAAKVWVAHYNALKTGQYNAVEEAKRKAFEADMQLLKTNPQAYYLKHPTEQPGYYGNSYQQLAPATNSNNSKPQPYKSLCPNCNGSGYYGQGYYTTKNGSRVFERPRCITCSGSGYILKY